MHSRENVNVDYIREPIVKSNVVRRQLETKLATHGEFSSLGHAHWFVSGNNIVPNIELIRYLQSYLFSLLV